jgi:hypothetical protein
MQPIRIDFGESLATWTQRCLISGARALDDREARELGYDPGAVIPTSPRQATVEDLRPYAASAAHPAAATAQFTRFDEQTLALLGELGPWAKGDEHEFSLTLQATVTFSHIERFPAKPGQLTTTPNLHTGKRTLAGFHRDDEYPKEYFGKLERGSVPPRRVGICLTGEHFLVLGFASELEQAEPNPDTAAIRRFVAAQGRLTCIWVRLSAGMAYVAPLRDGRTPHVGSGWGLTQDCAMAVCVGHCRRDSFARVSP